MALLQPVASTINTLAAALYKVFLASSDEAKTEMREACFDYLSLGGVCSSGPVALLSGLNPRPLSLVLHFFAVAIYAVGRLMLPFPSIKSFWLGARIISVCGSHPLKRECFYYTQHRKIKLIFDILLFHSALQASSFP